MMLSLIPFSAMSTRAELLSLRRWLDWKDQSALNDFVSLFAKLFSNLELSNELDLFLTAPALVEGL